MTDPNAGEDESRVGVKVERKGGLQILTAVGGLDIRESLNVGKTEKVWLRNKVRARGDC